MKAGRIVTGASTEIVSASDILAILSNTPRYPT